MQEEGSSSLKPPKDFCRICGRFQAFRSINLFHKLPALLQQKVLKILPYTISLDDRLPKNCCFECIDKLEEFISFLDKSWTIQRMFHRKVCIEEQNPSEPGEITIPLPNTWYGPEVPEVKSKDCKKATEVRPEEIEEVIISSGESEHSERTRRKERREANKKDRLDGHEAHSDNDTVSSVSWQRRQVADENSPDGKSKKKKLKFRRKNPSCIPPRVKRSKKRIRDEPQPKQEESKPADRKSNETGLCQLFLDGEAKLVPKPSGLQSDSFFIYALPGPNRDLIYYCTTCDIMYTSKTAAANHLCKLTGASSVPSEHSDSTFDVSPVKRLPYTCQMCSANFPRPAAPNDHVTSPTQNTVSDEDIAPPRARRRRIFSESSAALSESSDGASSCDDVIDSDNFVVDDDDDDDECDFVQSDEGARRKKTRTRTRKVRTRSRNKRVRYIFD